MANKKTFSPKPGDQFGKLTVLGEGGYKGTSRMILCRCSCGQKKLVRAGDLKRGKVSSCGNCPRISKENDYYRYTCKSGKTFIFDEDDLELVEKYSWSIDEHGYPSTQIRRGKNIRLHRFIMGFPDCPVDHKNRDKTDNRRRNLRLATTKENNRNQDLRRHNTSGYKGVSLHKRLQKYSAQIRVDGKSLHLGYFTDPVEAAKTYDQAAAFYFGEFASPNFPRKEEIGLGREKEQTFLEVENPLVYQRSGRNYRGANPLS